MRCSQQQSFLAVLILCLLMLQACGGNGTQSTALVASPMVNGFGPATNHVHSFLAASPTVLLLATHDGTYRSQNAGKTWQQVSGGTGQPMQGLMDYSLTASPLDPQRLYLLTEAAINQPQGIAGLYTSTNQGRTWQLTIPTARFSAGSIFFAVAGNEAPGEVYLYFPDQGAAGLKVSRDAGKHFTTAGPLPFSNLLGLLALPGAPGRLLVYGDTGMAQSTDGGKHWQSVQGINGGIIDLIATGPGRPLYADGDAGMFVSTDEGKTFLNVNAQVAYGALCGSTASPQTLYGKTGTAIYRSNDGGRSWQALPRIQGNLANLLVDPMDAQQVYLALSYPTQVYHFDRRRATWMSLTPQEKEQKG